MSEQLTDYPDAWRPQKGDTLAGEVADLASLTGAYKPYPCVTVKQDNGVELAFHGFHSVATAKLVELKPKVGERIAITYLGKIAAKDPKNKPYHNYRVTLPERPVGEIDWAAFDDGAPILERPEPVAATASAQDDDIPF